MLNKDVNNRAADRFSQFVNSRQGLLLLGIWAFFEPSFWFIAPDMFLQLMCLYSPKKYIKYFFVTLTSALAGVSFYFVLNLFFFDKLGKILLMTPFVNEGMILQIKSILITNGLRGLLFQAFSFMSVKIWVHIGVENKIPFYQFIFLTGLSRALRFFLFALISSQIGLRLNSFLRSYFIAFVILYVVGFITMLVFLETRFVIKY